LSRLQQVQKPKSVFAESFSDWSQHRPFRR
jgi:hypothetical protein